MPCQCPLSSTPFVCPRHKIEMSPEYHTICRGQPLIIEKPDGTKVEVPYDQKAYLTMWKGMADAGHVTVADMINAGSKASNDSGDDPETDWVTNACSLIGREIGTTPCNCGGSKTKLTSLFNCPVRGQCSITPARSQKIAHCGKCDSYIRSPVRILNTSDLGKKPDRRKAIVTIGAAIGGGEEFSAIWATFNSILLYHSDAVKAFDIEFLIVDCQHQTKAGESTARWIRSKPRVTDGSKTWTTGRYIPWAGPDGTSQPRNAVFEYATGDFVIVVDPHVFLKQGAIEAIVRYLEGNPKDLVFGPLYDDNGSVSWYQRPQWGVGALGQWTNSLDNLERSPEWAGSEFIRWQREREGDRTQPFEIWQQGFGLFACRRESWPGFHPDFREWGGCETYGCEAVRANGGRAICLPDAGWWHRFQRPMGVTWKATDRQKLKNYLIGFHKLGLKVEFLTAIDHYINFRHPKTGAQLLPESAVQEVIREVLATYGPPNWSEESSETLTPWASQLLAAGHSGEVSESEA